MPQTGFEFRWRRTFRPRLIRLATLAANSHNARPWKFRIGAGAIDVLPDLGRET